MVTCVKGAFEASSLLMLIITVDVAIDSAVSRFASWKLLEPDFGESCFGQADHVL